MGRRSAYRAAARGDLPTLRVGRRLLVPTARLLQLLGVDPPDDHQLRAPRPQPGPAVAARRVRPPTR
ncbi:MAG: hypothetical protein M3N17_00900 [Actinomycetota bacterium]|nr:hypothetical protein [Actinomycetota bacterium]